jgi:glycosyltransferase involved in cell wall biosynthesis
MEQAAASPLGATYDILHQHSLWLAHSRVTSGWRATFKRPTIVAPHGTLEEYILKRSVWKKRFASLAYQAKNLRLASCLHALSATEVVNIRDYGLRNPVAIIPNGISDVWLASSGDASRFRIKYSISSGKRVLLFLSRIHPKKGVPLLFEAMSSARSQLNDWHLVIAGPDERGHRAELEALSYRLGIEDMIQFVGPLFDEEKRDAFAVADVFVLPTLSEGSPISVLEALGAGVPVLTTYGTPWQELQTFRCGWWVEISVAAIQKALLEAAQNPRGELAAMGLRGQALVAEKYTWPRVAEKSLALYQWLLGRGEQPDFVVTE